MSAEVIRFGLLGVDSPHAPSFTTLWGDGRTGEVPGGTVTCAWAGTPAEDFPLSGRTSEHAARLEAGGVRLCADPGEVAEQVDAVLITASDARTHPGLFDRVAPYGKPIWVDTRFALTLAEADMMLAAAAGHDVLVLAGSPKRFTQEAAAVLAQAPARAVALSAPLPEQPGHPVLDWYGFHLVDLAVGLLGPDCSTVHAPSDGPVELSWADGRRATLTGPPEWEPTTSGVVDLADGTRRSFSIESGPAMLRGLLAALVTAVADHRPTVPLDQVRTITAVVEAARRSRATGEPIAV